MKHDTDSFRLRPEGLAVTGTLLALGQLAAQTAVPAEKKKDEGAQKTDALSDVVVDANKDKQLYKPENLQSPKFTKPIRDIPQTLTVVPEEVIQQQNATNLRDVLRNVPGISMQAGEGGGGPAGDNFSIRGFSARSDIFVDGLRDTSGGGYSRDPFNLEQVEVAKGPASTTNGRGSTGGSLNLSSKTPKLDAGYGLMLGGGTDDYFRGTFDVNQPIPKLNGAAFRVNGVYHTQDIAGRDFVENERWGIAPSLAFGLGTDTRVTLSYLHLEQDNVPDYGIPFVPRTSVNPALPGGIPAVDFDNYYGILGRDYEKIQTDLITLEFEHDFSDVLKLHSATRVGRSVRDSVTSAPRFVNGVVPPGSPTGSTFPTTTLNRQFQSRDQIDETISHVTDLRFDFSTGPINHELIGGVELARENSTNYGRSAPAAPTTDLYHPTPWDPYTGSPVRNGAVSDATADSYGFFLFDTAEIGEHWLVTLGGRWDSFDATYTNLPATFAVGPPASRGVYLARTDQEFSYRGAVTYKPCEQGSIYLGYGTSFNPSTEGLTYSTSPALVATDPEESETIELGTKWDLFEEKLQLTAALFRTDKTNARTTDPVTSVITITGEQRVQGLELGAAGRITDEWAIFGGYTYMDSEVLDSVAPLEIGNEVSNTPQHSFSLWTTYALPYGFTIGAGTQYVDSRYNNHSNRNTRQEVPSYTLIDAMVAYKVNDNLTFQLNGKNLADKDYVDRVGGGHFVPGEGRSFVLSALMNF
ncbi:TonB-dependent receptor [Luteolibacter sp. Populi]|uniref:TonB-dependent receptor n=1 Tax=Luteolibacter sp. Populi TaxID=3230487 RepID=UPI00346600D0